MVEVQIDVDKCSNCGKCVDVCPEKVFKLQEVDGKKLSKVVAEKQCFACRACEVRCPERAIQITGFEILKVDPPLEYPPEEGRFLRGNDYSPVAVVAILDTFDYKIPPELLRLVEVAIESGAALAGTFVPGQRDSEASIRAVRTSLDHWHCLPQQCPSHADRK